MKPLAIFSILLFIVSITFAQQQNQTSDSALNRNTTSISWSTGTSHNLGMVKLNAMVSYTFEFTNEGKEPITIIKANASCSCTAPSFTKDAVPPGQKGFVKAVFNANKPGVFEKTISVRTDNNETVVLKISGEVIQ